MKGLFICLFMTCLFTSVAFAENHGQQDDTICAAMQESNTRSIKSLSTTATKTRTKGGATAQ